MASPSHDNPIAQSIFQAAVRLFAQKGFAATSTREIVEAAGVTKPMLYYYFESKEGLCRAALAHFLGQFHGQLRQTVQSSHPSREYLEEVIWTHFDFCRANEDFARLMYALYFGPEDLSSDLDLKCYTQRGQDLLEEAVSKVSSVGLVRPGCEASLTMALHGMINIWVMAALKKDARLSRSVARQIVEDLLEGFGVTEATGEGK